MAEKKIAQAVKQQIVSLLHSGSSQIERPYLRKHNESNIQDCSLWGTWQVHRSSSTRWPKGMRLLSTLRDLPGAIGGPDEDLLDVVIVGAGAGGLNAALQAQERGLRYVLIEKEQIANTIENFPEGKWVYAEPDSQPPKGKLWLDGASKEELTRPLAPNCSGEPSQLAHDGSRRTLREAGRHLPCHHYQGAVPLKTHRSGHRPAW